jgi:hypothetical protein
VPIMINQRDQGRKNPEEKKPVARMQAVTTGGLLSDVKTVVAIFGGVILLVIGLLGWSQGWFDGAAAVPANASSQTSSKAIAPTGSSDESNPMGNKRNKGMGE